MESHTIHIITVSDRCYTGEREDKSGPALEEFLRNQGFSEITRGLVPDEKERIMEALTEAAERDVALVLTTGGTGLAPRDVTPEATLAVIEKAVPGIPEAIRAESLKITPRAMLSRAVAGIRGQTLIVNLPGSPKAVKESLEVFLPVLEHAMETLSGKTLSCGKDVKP